MAIFSVVLALAILACVVGGAYVFRRRVGRGDSLTRRVLRVGAEFFLVYGAFAFIAPALCAIGGQAFLPQSFEWPLAAVSGVVRDSEEHYIAPHPPSGRVQVYDRDKRFLRGWNVNANGGTFKLGVTDDDLIEVFTARGNRHFIFRLDGSLVSEHDYDQTSLSDIGQSAEISESFPTPFLLLPFTHPLAGWVLLAFGMVGQFILGRTKKPYSLCSVRK